MKRAVCLIAAVAAMGLVFAAGASASAPAIRLASMQPLVVRGSGFEPRELVRVTVVRAVGTRKRTVRATAAGKIVVRFRLNLAQCPGWKIIARGNRGSRAVLRSNPHVDCAQLQDQ